MKAIALLLASLSCLCSGAETVAPGTVPQGLTSSDWHSIRAAYEAGRHAVERMENGSLAARNPGQQWRMEFDGKGFLVTPDHRDWTWGLELIGYGGKTFGSASSAIIHEGGKITHPRDENFTEWFINDTRGLEQGWIIHSRNEDVSTASGGLTLTLAVRGHLRPLVSTDGASISFQTESGSPALTYGGLKAWDADGKKLAVRFEANDSKKIRITLDDRNARYPVTIDPIAQQAYLKAGNNGAPSDDLFGGSVSVSGDTVIVGARGEDSSSTGVDSTSDEEASDSGAAYIFVRNGTTWTQQAYLKASNTGAGDLFGYSVAVADDIAVVGAYEEDSSTTGVNSAPNESATRSGAAYVFTRSGTTWSQQAYLKASNTDASDQFATSVAVAGETVIIGANGENSSTTGVNSTPNESADTAGAAYVFVRAGTVWSQQAYLKAGNTSAGDNFGFSVAVAGDTAVIGAYGEDSSTTGVNSTPNEIYGSSGAAYVFVRSGTTWSQQAFLKASNTGVQDSFGNSVAVSGDTVIVGARYEDSGTMGVDSTPNEAASDSGAAYIFVRSGTEWSQQTYLKAGNTGAQDNFGTSVAVSGDTVVIGAPGEDSSTAGVNSPPNNSSSSSGAAYVFVRAGTVWSQQAFLKASNPEAQDNFGESVAVSGDTVIAGAFGENSSTTGVNSTPNGDALSSGSAYIFVRGGTTWTQQAYLKASNTPANSGANDQFGRSVAVSGDTVVIGAPNEDSSTTGVDSTPNEAAIDSGAAYIFVRSGTAWSQQAYLKASNTDDQDNFGISVAVSGDTVVIGAAYEDDFARGAAYVFIRSGTIWSQQAYLKGTNAESSSLFGESVAISGDTLVVGALNKDNSTPTNTTNSGAAYVFVRGGTTWTQQAYLIASNPDSNDNFGDSVAVSGDTVIVGSYGEDSSTSGVNTTPDNNSSGSGAAYVFVRSGTAWSQQAYLKASNPGAQDNFGNSVAASGDTVVVGAFREDSSTTGVNSTPNNSAGDSGAAYVFVRSGTAWSQQAYLKASNTDYDENFGHSVAVSGDIIAAGAYREDSSTTGVNSTPNDSNSPSGAAYVFARSETTWSQQAYLKGSNTGAGDAFAYSVAVSGGTLIVGAHGEDSSRSGVDSTPNENSIESGAAYVFDLDTLVPTPEIAIEQAGEGVGSGITKDFGSAVEGTIQDRMFIVLNIGNADLYLNGTPKVALTGSDDFTVTAQPASPINGSTGSTTFTVRFIPSSVGSKTAALSIPNNDTDENFFVINLSGLGVTAKSVFDTAASASSLAGPDAEANAMPFHDGVKNLLKYAFNMNMGAADVHGMVPGGTSGLPAIELTGSGPSTMIRVEYLRRIGSGLVYTPKRSSTLIAGSFTPMTATPAITPVNAAWERVVVQESADPATVPALFAIVEVILP